MFQFSLLVHRCHTLSLPVDRHSIAVAFFNDPPFCPLAARKRPRTVLLGDDGKRQNMTVNVPGLHAVKAGRHASRSNVELLSVPNNPITLDLIESD